MIIDTVYRKTSRLLNVGSKKASWKKKKKLAWESPHVQEFHPPDFLWILAATPGFQKITGLSVPSTTCLTAFSVVLAFGFLEMWLAWSTSGLTDLSSTVVDTVTAEMSLWILSSRSRVLVSLSVGDEDELEEDEQWLSFLESVLEVDESDPEDEFVEKHRTTIRTKFSVVHCIRIPFKIRRTFWPLIHSQEYPFSSQSFPSDHTAGVFSRTFIVKNMSNSLTYTVASSCVCTSPLSIMTIVGLHDFVKVSISGCFKSFCWSYALTHRSRQQILGPQV